MSVEEYWSAVENSVSGFLAELRAQNSLLGDWLDYLKRVAPYLTAEEWERVVAAGPHALRWEPEEGL